MKALLCLPVNIAVEITKALWALLGSPFRGFHNGVNRAADILNTLKYERIMKGGSKC